MASCLRVRAFSTASSALLKLKHHHYRCYTTVQPHNKLASRISRSPQFVFSPSFSRLFSTTDQSTNPTTDDDEAYGSESDSDSESNCHSDSDENCHSDSDDRSQSDSESNIVSREGFVPESGYSNGMKVDWHIDSKCYNILYSKKFTNS